METIISDLNRKLLLSIGRAFSKQAARGSPRNLSSSGLVRRGSFGNPEPIKHPSFVELG